MKKTYTINLSGKIFHIDEDALEKLQEYINTLKTYYTQEEDGNESMDDIENRIGELFTENLKGQFREVITLDDVDQAIATMGTPLLFSPYHFNNGFVIVSCIVISC